MARKRMIDPKFWTDDKIIEMDPICRLLFIGIWNFADDKGLHLNNSKVLKAEIFPADEITVAEVQEMKDKLLELGMIEISDDKKLFRIRNWGIYQKINRPQPSKYEFSEHSVNDNTLFIGKEIEGNINKDNKIKDNNVQKVKKPSVPKPYKDRVAEYFNNIDKADKDLYKEAYPNIDIDRELVKAKMWLLTNTHKAKKQFGRFVNNWLSSAMDNAARYGTNFKSAEDQIVKIKEERIERERKARMQYMKQAEQNAASDEEVKDIIGNTLKKMGGKKDG
tara:strand:+ start:865 stop:1698 length:834 start_codon:yes stop_codon:yes gene_type:complete